MEGRRINRRIAQAPTAQGMVEFALVLPLLLVVMLAVIEFGRLLFIYSAVFTASREAARYGAATGITSGNTARYQDCTGMRAAAMHIGDLVGISNSDIAISYDNGTGSTIGGCPVNGLGPADITLGDIIRIKDKSKPADAN